MTRVRTSAIAAVAALLLAVTTSSAGLPGWADEVVARAPALPEGVPEDDYRTLLYDASIEVAPNGRMTTRFRIARQVLSTTAFGVSGQIFGSDDNSKVKKLDAWHRPSREDGKRRATEKSKKRDQEVFSSEDVFTDDTLLHAVGGWDVEPGSIVFFEAVIKESPYSLSTAIFFDLEAPLTLGRVSIEMPAGWSMKSGWLRRDGGEPTVSGNVYSWELRDLPAFEAEELGHAASDRSPLLVLSLIAPDGVETVGPSLPDWDAVAAWYNDLATGMADPDDAVRSVADGLIAQHDLPSALLAVAGEVRDKIRYVAKEVGIGGYQPRPAVDTWTNRYGDCKDKATLMQSMLAARDIPSYPVMINLTDRGMVSEEVPGPFLFNHLILAVPLPTESATDLSDLPAVLPDSPLGPLMFFDTTNDVVSPGWLSASLSGKKGLVMSETEGHVIELPAWTPSAHRIEREVRARPAGGGAWEFTCEDRRYGQYAASRRAFFRNSASDAEDYTFRTIKAQYAGADPETFEVHDELPDGAYVENTTWTVPRLNGGPDLWILPPFPEANDLISTTSVTRRTGPVVYSFPRRMTLTAIVEGIPDHYLLPDPYERTGDGWSVTTEWQREDGDVRGTMTFVLEKTVFTADEYRDLRRMYAALKKQASFALKVPG